jgi:hypothetical protein
MTKMEFQVTILAMLIQEAGQKSAEATTSGPWNAVPSLFFGVLVAIFVGVFYKQIRSLIDSLVWRIKVGAQFKIGTIEVGAINADSQLSIAELQKRDQRVHGPVGDRVKERDEIYERLRKTMLVHRLVKSPNPKHKFDILIYLIAHKDGSLEGIAEVEYFFGKWWGNQVFSSRDRYNGFAVCTAAYGPFLCTARAKMNDGKEIVNHYRYIDFEMGGSAPARFPPGEEPKAPEGPNKTSISPNPVVETEDGNE